MDSATKTPVLGGWRSTLRTAAAGVRLGVETLWTAGTSLRAIYTRGADQRRREEDRRRTLRHLALFTGFVALVVWRETQHFKRLAARWAPFMIDAAPS